MPKAIQYKSNSVIYFAGDIDDRVFLLQKGHIALNSTDVETGKQITDYIKEGEFFGVKSALGHFPREESVLVIADSICLAFSTAEFEAFAMTNTRIIMKMLKVFSTQLRQIHHQIESILHSEEQTDCDDGMFSVASCFYKSRQYQAASQVAVRYLRLYPGGKHVQDMKQMAQMSITPQPSQQAQKPSFSPSDTGPSSVDPNLSMTLAQGLIGQGKWDEAYKQYHSIIELGDTPQTAKAYVGAGKCLFELREYARCIQLLTQFVSNYPKSILLSEALMYMGKCYQELDQNDKAKAFYTKARALATPQLAQEIQSLLESVGG
ncbi:cyclic nucleotide-binding domain-containing protein [Brucepastera parasyntrophica]|uniref:cyclic nucleotide-binding domain-containing protein n=1 Tax=Brucepastera parasyntrophica TaxID=2880008 RepID=UPI002109CC42|nr:cyclic nucleotide-binding domain-containing protein [Brucepastera parasyntrophica]ULQ59169.1 cyclic nucleotide-binding domain-containing protein [Brucepastera parasyntrophica]